MSLNVHIHICTILVCIWKVLGDKQTANTYTFYPYYTIEKEKLKKNNNKIIKNHVYT